MKIQSEALYSVLQKISAQCLQLARAPAAVVMESVVRFALVVLEHSCVWACCASFAAVCLIFWRLAKVFSTVHIPGRQLRVPQML